MQFDLYEVNEENKNIIFNLMQLYTYELSFFEDSTTNFKLSENGLFKIEKYVNLYWKEKGKHPFILKCDENLAGFTLISVKENDLNKIDEFFVFNKYRKKGVGRLMATKIINKYRRKMGDRSIIK